MVVNGNKTVFILIMGSDMIVNDGLRRVTMRVTFCLDVDGNVVSAVGSPTGDVDVVDLYHVLSYLSSDIRFNRTYHSSVAPASSLIKSTHINEVEAKDGFEKVD